MKYNYYLKHWITTILLGTLLPIVASLIFDNKTGPLDSLFELYLIFLPFAAILSMPTLFIYYVIYNYLKTIDIKPTYIKLILILWTVIGLSLTLFSLGEQWTLNFISDYSLAAIISGVIWKFDSEDVDIPEN